MRDPAKPALPLFANAQLYCRSVWNLLHPWLSDFEAKRRRWFALADESCSFGIAPTDIGNAHCCSRSDRSAVESLLRLIFRTDTRCPLSPLSRTKWLTAKYFAAHPNETEISGPQLMDWARRSFHTAISGSDRDETLERIQGLFTPSANEK